MIRFNFLDLLYTYSSSFLVMASSLLVMILINNELGVDKYGVFIYYLSITSFATALFSFRSGEVIVKILTNGDLSARNLFVSAFILDSILFVLITMTIGVGSWFYFIVLEKGSFDDFLLIIILGAASSLQIFSGIPNGTLLFNEEYRIVSLIRLVMPTSRIVLVLCSFAFGLSVELVSWSYLISTIIGLIVSWMVFLRRNSFTFLALPYQEFKRYFLIARNIYSSLFFKSLITNADTIIIGTVSSSERLGVYQTIKLVLQPTNFIANPLGNILYPKFTKAAKNRTHSEIKKSINIYSSGLFLFSLFFVILILCFNAVFFQLTKVQITNNLDILFLICSQIIALATADWWFRPFSLTYNPSYSLYWSIFIAFYIWLLVFPTSLIFGLYAYISCMIFINFIRPIVFWCLLQRKGTTKNES